MDNTYTHKKIKNNTSYTAEMYVNTIMNYTFHPKHNLALVKLEYQAQ